MSDNIKNGFFAHLLSASHTAEGKVKVVAEVGCGYESEKAEFVLLEELYLTMELSGTLLTECVSQDESLSQEDIEKLDFYASVSRAYVSMCTSFAYSPNSYRGLFRKVLQKGFSREVAEKAIEIVREKGFVDEESIATRRAEMLVKKLWGRSRIFAKLREDGFGDEGMSAASEYLSEIDFSEFCADAIRKKYGEMPCDRREREKIYAALARLGYSSSDIREAVCLLDKE